ncbi:hypothetical protein Vadar_014414 [Vaccinium darrowii]|uniref:Uncharacterized protein n=1 Tax=Vaccinium darrowii TaxID=229202 RepID=A0ACB7ZK94_9ERIC|nr:hypothetical protein Vadar_014414 [Vaccinium darrowii]
MEKLPEECWEWILNRLAANDNDRELQCPSLTCKQFLSTSNRSRRKFSAFNKELYHNGCEALYRAFKRFPNLEKLELYRPYDRAKPIGEVDIDIPIEMIASSGLNIRSLAFYTLPKAPSPNSFRKLGSTMRNLKRLICYDIKSLADVHIVTIADELQWLEELGIIFRNNGSNACPKRYPQLSDLVVTDAGIEVISSKLLGLRKIDLTGNHRCSDRSLIALSSNCVHLEGIQYIGNSVTKDGIGFVLYHSPNLISLQAEYRLAVRNSSFSFEASKICTNNLRELDLCGHGFQDPLLYCIVEAGIPLEKLTLRNDFDLSFNGLSTLLCACPSLKYLHLRGIRFLDDDSIRNLCRYLGNVVSVKLLRCGTLSIVAYFILAKECHALSEIKLDWSSSRSFDADYLLDMDLEIRNYSIGTLDLSCNQHLTDELLRRIAVTCPNLHTLDVRLCGLLTIEGILEILNHCLLIKHLMVPKHMKVLSETFESRQIKVGYL